MVTPFHFSKVYNLTATLSILIQDNQYLFYQEPESFRLPYEMQASTFYPKRIGVGKKKRTDDGSSNLVPFFTFLNLRWRRITTLLAYRQALILQALLHPLKTILMPAKARGLEGFIQSLQHVESVQETLSHVSTLHLTTMGKAHHWG